MDEQTLQQRLESILTLINNRADQQIALAESNYGSYEIRDNALSFALGARFARDLIQDEFQEFWPDNDTGEVIYVEPITYIESNDNIFIDARGKFFFWDEIQSCAYGPYNDEVEAKREMARYNDILNSYSIGDI